MSLTQPLLMQKLSAKLSYLTERQALLAQNISNIDTPNYRARDLKKINFENMVQASSGRLSLSSSSVKHLTGTLETNQRYTTVKDREAEDKKPLGNNIVLEEQMGKISDVGAQNQMTTTLMRKFNQLYRSAVDSRAS